MAVMPHPRADAALRCLATGQGERHQGRRFSSDLSVDEAVLLKEVGYEPRGLVIGCGVYHIGIQYQNWSNNEEMTGLTQVMYAARADAIRRMQTHAAKIGAHGVIGLKLEVRIDRDRVILATAAFDAFVARDVDAFARAVDELGWLPPDRAATALEVLELGLGDLAGPGPVRLDREAVLAARDRLIGRPDGIVELVLHGELPPQDLWPARGVAQLFGTIARVGATADWRDLIGKALHDGWTTADR